MDMEYKKPILFVRFHGKLSRKNNHKINNYLISVLKKHQIKYLVCNLWELEEIDISGMEALFNLKCIMKSLKGKMFLCNIHSRIEAYLKPLKIKHIDNEFLAVELLGAKTWKNDKRTSSTG